MLFGISFIFKNHRSHRLACLFVHSCYWKVIEVDVSCYKVVGIEVGTV